MVQSSVKQETKQARWQPNSITKDEKRYLPRWSVEQRVIVRFPSERRGHECVSRDVSGTGACVITHNQNVPLRRKIRLTIFFSDRSAVEVEGHAVWHQNSTEGTLVGITFDNVSTETQEAILNHAFDVQRESMVNHWFKGC